MFRYLLILLFSSLLQAQNMTDAPPTLKAKTEEVKKHHVEIPDRIPKKQNGLFGFSDQSGKMMIPAEYSNVGFFTEDCNLLNSPSAAARKYGTAEYASVRYRGEDYRIDKKGKRVYHFKDKDLGQCPSQFRAQLFHAYIMGKMYGIIEDAKFDNPYDYRQFTIYPQYEYLHILEGDDLENPMIIAVRNNKFGVIDIHQRIIIPFVYHDIKRNYSWKLARLFEVSDNGRDYYFVDKDNRAY